MIGLVQSAKKHFQNSALRALQFQHHLLLTFKFHYAKKKPRIVFCGSYEPGNRSLTDTARKHVTQKSSKLERILR